MLGFLLWAALGIIFIGIGVFSFFSKKPMGFWANVPVFPVSEYRSYNHAVGKLFCVFGIVFVLLGLPLLQGQNSPFVILSVVGVVIETILAMAVYTLKIESKYRKK